MRNKDDMIPYLRKKFSLEQPNSLNIESYQQWLEQEQKFLNKQLSIVCQGETGSSSLDADLKECQAELYKLTADNRKKFKELDKKLEENYENLGMDWYLAKSRLSDAGRRRLEEASEDLNLLRVYLRQIIYRLEQRQISDSIKRIGRSFTDDYGGKHHILRLVVFYEVWFEDAFVKEPVFLEEEYVESLNKLRKYSLFCVHKKASKSNSPYYSHNVS